MDGDELNIASQQEDAPYVEQHEHHDDHHEELQHDQYDQLAEPQAEAQPEYDYQADTQDQSLPEFQPESQEPQSEFVAQAEEQLPHHGHSEFQYEPESQPEPEPELQAEPEPQPETHAEFKFEPEPEPQPEPEPEPETHYEHPQATHHYETSEEQVDAPQFHEELAPVEHAAEPEPVKHHEQLADERTNVHVELGAHAHAEPEPEPQLKPEPVHKAEPATPVARHEPAEPSPTVKPSSMAKEKSPSPGAAGDSCCVCGKKVYPLERLVAEKNVFHKTCFRCKKCNRTLSSSNYATLNNDYYCKPHQLELFRLQGRYEVSETQAEVVNRSTSESPASDAATHSENSAEDLRRARAVFEHGGEQQAGSTSSPQANLQYGGVGALKSRFLANASQNSEANRPPPRKITPPRQEFPVVSQKTNGSETEHGEFENEPMRIDGVVRETDRGQLESEMPKQGAAKSALAMFRNLELSGKGASADSSQSSHDAAH